VTQEVGNVFLLISALVCILYGHVECHNRKENKNCDKLSKANGIIASAELLECTEKLTVMCLLRMLKVASCID